MSVLQNYLKAFSRISSNKGRASNKRRPLMNAEALGIHIKMSASSLISAAYLYLNATLITVCNFQSMKTPVELNSLLSKFFYYIT